MAETPYSARPVVLLVEDEELTALALQDCLVEQQFTVILAGDGIAALERAAQDRFDILLTDLRMPRMGGPELIRALRAGRPDLPVIIMTGHPTPDWRERLQRPGEGRMVLLHKPVHLRAILDALRDVWPPPADCRGDPAGDPTATAPAV